MRHTGRSEPVRNPKLFRYVRIEMSEPIAGTIVRLRIWHWCWGCLRPRRFHEVRWLPLGDELMRWRQGYFMDGAGHVR